MGLGDLLEAPSLISFITFLRALISHLKTSAQKYEKIGEKIEEVERLVQELGSSTEQLEKQVLEKEGGDEVLTEEDQAEIDEIKKQLKVQAHTHTHTHTRTQDKKINLADSTAKLKAAGRRRRLRGYLVVRWLSFFNSIDSVYAM